MSFRPITTEGFAVAEPATSSGPAVLLDLLARQHAAGRVDGFEDHHAFEIEPADFGRAWDALVHDGLAEARGGLVITAAGLALHAAPDRARAALASTIGSQIARAA